MIEEALRRQLADDQLTDVLAMVRERSDRTDEPSHPKNTVRRRGASRHEGRLRAREFSLYGIQRMESPSLLYERAPALRRKRLPRTVSVVLHRSAPHAFGFVPARTEGIGVLETGEDTVRITFWQDLIRPCRDLSYSVERPHVAVVVEVAAVDYDHAGRAVAGDEVFERILNERSPDAAEPE